MCVGLSGRLVAARGAAILFLVGVSVCLREAAGAVFCSFIFNK